MISALAALFMLLALAAGIGLAARSGDETGPGDGAPVACTEEAKLCPDGSAVGRNGPQCRFDACPLEQGAGVIQGRVTIGPLGPNVGPGPTETPPPSVYAQRSIVLTAQGGAYVKTVPINNDGTYTAWLWPGTYVIDINHAGVDTAKDFPREVEVAAGGSLTIDIEIDTGIR